MHSIFVLLKTKQWGDKQDLKVNPFIRAENKRKASENDVK